MVHRLCSGCCWGKFTAKCQWEGWQHFPFLHWRLTVLLLAKFQESLSSCPQGYGWMIFPGVKRGGFLNSDWSVSRTAPCWHIRSVPARSPCSSLATWFYSWKVCVCVGQWVGRGRKGDMIGDNGSTWFHIFPYLFHFIFGPWLLKAWKARIWLFFSSIIITLPYGKLCLLWLSKLMGQEIQ